MASAPRLQQRGPRTGAHRTARSALKAVAVGRGFIDGFHLAPSVRRRRAGEPQREFLVAMADAKAKPYPFAAIHLPTTGAIFSRHLRRLKMRKPTSLDKILLVRAAGRESSAPGLSGPEISSRSPRSPASRVA